MISEQRRAPVDVRAYARSVVRTIDSLVAGGVPADHITVVGTSRGGYIAQYVATYAHNPALNFVFVASHRDADLETLPEINYCGNILSIYDRGDPFGVSATRRRALSDCPTGQFREVVIDEGLGHGFLFRPLEAWLRPAAEWALGRRW